MRAFLRSVLLICGIFAASPAHTAGVIPFALTQQVDSNGRPLVGCQLYIYQAGTTATLQNVFSDFGLSLPLPNPLSCDANGRLPSFYLADGQVHVRLTDPGGVPLIDVPVLQVVGPSSGGGGGGGTVDPTAIASTGDIKFRATSEILSGWVKMNGLTVGSATSGATGRANNDTQNLFVYLWTNCPNAHCPVLGGRGASASADFNANKQITTLDWRARTPAGLDDMGTTPAGRLAVNNVTSGGGDGVTTPNATGGEANHTLLVAELAAHNHPLTDTGHAHAYSGITGIENQGITFNFAGTTSANTTGIVIGSNNASVIVGGSGIQVGGGLASTTSTITLSDPSHAHTFSGTTGTQNQNHNHSYSGVTAASGAGVSIASVGSSTPFNNMSPFVLGTWYIKL